MKTRVSLIVLLLVQLTAVANVTLPHVFSDNMVLQRGSTIPVWGWADAKEKITVRFNKQVKTVTADKQGKWRIDLDA